MLTYVTFFKSCIAHIDLTIKQTKHKGNFRVLEPETLPPYKYGEKKCTLLNVCINHRQYIFNIFLKTLHKHMYANIETTLNNKFNETKSFKKKNHENKLLTPGYENTTCRNEENGQI